MDEDLNQVADALEAQWYANPRPRVLPWQRRGGRIVIVLDAPAKLLTMNAAKSTHYRPWALLTKAWRAAMCDRCELLGIPAVHGRVGVEARTYQLGGILADPLGHAPVVKACIDGLRDAGVLRDDTGDY